MTFLYLLSPQHPHSPWPEHSLWQCPSSLEHWRHSHGLANLLPDRQETVHPCFGLHFCSLWHHPWDPSRFSSQSSALHFIHPPSPATLLDRFNVLCYAEDTQIHGSTRSAHSLPLSHIKACLSRPGKPTAFISPTATRWLQIHCKVQYTGPILLHTDNTAISDSPMVRNPGVSLFHWMFMSSLIVKISFVHLHRKGWLRSHCPLLSLSSMPSSPAALATATLSSYVSAQGSPQATPGSETFSLSPHASQVHRHMFPLFYGLPCAL